MFCHRGVQLQTGNAYVVYDGGLCYGDYKEATTTPSESLFLTLSIIQALFKIDPTLTGPFHSYLMDVQSFTLFPQLPVEIGESIWFFAVIPASVYIKPIGNKIYKICDSKRIQPKRKRGLDPISRCRR